LTPVHDLEGQELPPEGLVNEKPGNTKGGSITVPMTSYLKAWNQLYDNWQNKPIQISQTGGQRYIDTSSL